jgi:hypothetical protein
VGLCVDIGLCAAIAIGFSGFDLHHLGERNFGDQTVGVQNLEPLRLGTNNPKNPIVP